MSPASGKVPRCWMRPGERPRRWGIAPTGTQPIESGNEGCGLRSSGTRHSPGRSGPRRAAAASAEAVAGRAALGQRGVRRSAQASACTRSGVRFAGRTRALANESPASAPGARPHRQGRGDAPAGADCGVDLLTGAEPSRGESRGQPEGTRRGGRSACGAAARPCGRTFPGSTGRRAHGHCPGRNGRRPGARLCLLPVRPQPPGADGASSGPPCGGRQSVGCGRRPRRRRAIRAGSTRSCRPRSRHR